MSTGFNWFKSYKITIHRDERMWEYDDKKLDYIGGGSTSHSGYNIGLVQDLIEKYSGKRIPTIEEDWLESEDEDLGLIQPKEMSDICIKILDGKEVDSVGMRERIEWFKKLSDEGYYLSYDMC